MHRIKYYGINDLSNGLMAGLAWDYLIRLDQRGEIASITDAMEAWQSILFVENGILPDAESANDSGRAQRLAEVAKARIGVYFAAINAENIRNKFKGLDRRYGSDLVQAVVRYQLHNKINKADLVSELRRAGVSMRDLLKVRKFTLDFGDELRPYICEDPTIAELMLHQAAGPRLRSGAELFFPREVSTDEWSEILGRYLRSPGANLNYVRLAKDARLSDVPGLSDEIKILAVRRCKELETELFENISGGFRVRYEVRFSDSHREVVNSGEDGTLEILESFSEKWLRESLDYPSILNNLQMVFGLADDNAILTSPAYSHERQGLERLFGVEGRASYPKGAAFSTKEHLAFMKMAAYLSFLDSQEIDLEDVFTWFFEEYIAQEFGGVDICFRRSSRGSKYVERIRHLLSEMEGILRQFDLYAKYQCIDADRIQYGSDTVVFESISSVSDDKYCVVAEQDEIHTLIELLFSDQSVIRYISEDLSGENFAHLILSHNICDSEFLDYQKPAISWMRDRGVLDAASSQIKFRSLAQVLVLNRLFRVGAVNAHWLSVEECNELARMESYGWISRQATLFTRDEAKFLNYMLNDREYVDGPRLRNRYLHSRIPLFMSEEEERADFIRVMLLMAQIIIKINDDLRVAPLPGLDRDGDRT